MLGPKPDAITCQDPVDGRRDHFLPGEDDDVEDVCDGAEDANHDADVAVDLPIARIERFLLIFKQNLS